MNKNKLDNLPNKPLVEAIFEFRWELKKIARGVYSDEGWNTFPIKFFIELHGEYPEIVELPSKQIPDLLAAYTVQYQYRKGKEEWPLIQIGPGILTVNETDGYGTWENFRGRIKNALQVLNKVNDQITPLRADLRYVNAIPFNNINQSIVRFLKDRLNTSVEMSPKLFNGQLPQELSLSLNYSTEDPKGVSLVSFSTGLKKDEPVIIWQIAMRSDMRDLPEQIDNFENWLNSAHQRIEDCFITLTEGELLESFKGEKT